MGTVYGAASHMDGGGQDLVRMQQFYEQAADYVCQSVQSADFMEMDLL